MTTYQAADQDGFDGGYCAKHGDLVAWGETEAAALRNLVAMVMPGDWVMSVEQGETQLEF